MLATIALALSGSFYLALALAAFARPSTLLAGFGIAASGCDARNEIRAVYGGFPLAVALLVGWCLFGGEYAVGILVALTTATLGIALGRTISGVIDRRIGRLPAIFVGVELVVAALLATGGYAF